MNALACHSHWEKTLHSLLVGAILHVLYAEEEKTLARVATFLSDPQRSFAHTLRRMMATNHLGTKEQPQVHPMVASAAREVLNKSENERSGVLSTAMSFLGLHRDPIVACNTTACDWRISDLVDAAHPVSLYLVIPPSEISRTKPLVRLVLNQIGHRLTERLEADPHKSRKHQLLMMLDEFPALGRLDFFETALAFMAGHGIVERFVNGLGFTCIRERVYAVEAWLGSLPCLCPGHVYANVRQPLVYTLNLAHLMPLSSVWAGPARNEHLAKVTRTECPPLLYADRAPPRALRPPGQLQSWSSSPLRRSDTPRPATNRARDNSRHRRHEHMVDRWACRATILLHRRRAEDFPLCPAPQNEVKFSSPTDGARWATKISIPAFPFFALACLSNWSSWRSNAPCDPALRSIRKC
ncbi:hypothetical protein J2W40_001600 [Sphingobium xenophagum]|uniref:Conjugal transfer protein TraG n=1 Tax=Sphingobium xenophagum TaxID=121428 RepID=A0ABU1WZN7_SPHXE|nr:hypothetical protein [Sphingobium xenophagum]